MPPRVASSCAARATRTARCACVRPPSMRPTRAHGDGVAGLSCSGPGLVVGGRTPLTLGGRLAGSAAAHLLPALSRTRLAADVGLDELQFVHLPHDADLQSIPANNTHQADVTISATRGSCEHDAWLSALFGRGGGGSRAGRGGWHARTRWFSLLSMPHPKQKRRTWMCGA